MRAIKHLAVIDTAVVKVGKKVSIKFHFFFHSRKKYFFSLLGIGTPSSQRYHGNGGGGSGEVQDEQMSLTTRRDFLRPKATRAFIGHEGILFNCSFFILFLFYFNFFFAFSLF